MTDKLINEINTNVKKQLGLDISNTTGNSRVLKSSGRRRCYLPECDREEHDIKV